MDNGIPEFPKVSIIIPTRNRAEYLKRVLDALLADGYPNLEIIVRDGSSTDGTVELLKGYGQKVRWVSEPDGGEYFAFNKGFAMSTGEIVKQMADDDILRPGAIEAGVKFLCSHPSAEVVLGQYAVWYETKNGREFSFETHFQDRDLSIADFRDGKINLQQGAAFFRRSVFERLGPMATQYANSDLEFWYRCLFNNIRIHFMDQVLLDYYYTGKNGVIVKRWRIYKDRVKILAKYFGKRRARVWAIKIFLLSYLPNRICDVTGLRPPQKLRQLISGPARV